MADDGETTIIVVEEGDGVVVDKTEPKEAKAAPTDSPEAAVAELKKQLAEKDAESKANRDDADRNRKAATEAEQRARDAGGQTQHAIKVAQSHELDSITNALGAATREQEALEAKLTAAHEAGEFGTVAKLQGQLAKLGARLVQLEDGKAALDARAKEQPRQPQPVTEEQQREAYLARRTAPTAAWVRAHPQFFTDAAFKQKVEAADGYVANILGIARDTPEYFTKVEETVGIRQAAASAAAVVVDRTANAAAAEPAEPAKPASRPVPAATPSRSVPGARPDSAGGIKVSLTAEERAAAQWLHPRQKDTDPDPEVVYARNKHALIQEGRLLGNDGRPTGRQA